MNTSSQIIKTPFLVSTDIDSTALYESSKPKSNPKYCAAGPSCLTLSCQACSFLDDATASCGRTLVPLGPNIPHRATRYSG